VRAEIVAVGSELLTPGRVETNALFITEHLLRAGVEVIARTVVADDLEVLASTLKTALGRAEFVIATGGLGPTADDLTREAAGRALARPLHRDPVLLDELKARFARFKRLMADVNAQQADLIEGASPLRNPNGTAPGQSVEVSKGHLLFLLPGPPREMEPMFLAQVLPQIAEVAGPSSLRTRILKIASMGESDVEQIVAPIYTTYENPRTTILGGAGEVELRFLASGRTVEESEALLEDLAARIREKLGTRIYSEDGRDLPEVVAARLTERGLTLALAESCTGGKLASLLTEIPGASSFFLLGAVTYGNDAKHDLASVDAALIAAKGAVSEEVARAMAEGIRSRAGASIGVGITGIAGPTGGSPEKPLGLVYLALSGAAGSRVRRAVFPGDRNRVQLQASLAALDMIRRGLEGLDP
jgi:nicotinamide-nucleotide amidase